MNILAFDPVLVAGAMSTILSMFLLLLIFRVNRQLHMTQGELFRLQNEYQAISNGTIGIGKKILKIEGLVQRMETRQVRTSHSGHKNQKKSAGSKAVKEKARTDASLNQADPARSVHRGEAELLTLMRQKLRESSRVFAC